MPSFERESSLDNSEQVRDLDKKFKAIIAKLTQEVEQDVDALYAVGNELADLKSEFRSYLEDTRNADQSIVKNVLDTSRRVKSELLALYLERDGKKPILYL